MCIQNAPASAGGQSGIRTHALALPRDLGAHFICARACTQTQTHTRRIQVRNAHTVREHSTRFMSLFVMRSRVRFLCLYVCLRPFFGQQAAHRTAIKKTLSPCLVVGSVCTTPYKDVVIQFVCVRMCVFSVCLAWQHAQACPFKYHLCCGVFCCCEGDVVGTLPGCELLRLTQSDSVSERSPSTILCPQVGMN